METEGQQLFLSKVISYLRNLFITKDVTYQSLMNKARLKLFARDMDKIIILWYCYQSIFSKRSTFTKAAIVDNLTETEWDRFCNTYIGNETHNPPQVQTKTYLYHTDRIQSWRCHWKTYQKPPGRKWTGPSTSWIFSHFYHQRSLPYYWKTFRVPSAIGETIKRPKYKYENDLVFNGIYLGLFNIRLRGRVKNQRLAKNRGYVLWILIPTRKDKYQSKPVLPMHGKILSPSSSPPNFQERGGSLHQPMGWIHRGSERYGTEI